MHLATHMPTTVLSRTPKIRQRTTLTPTCSQCKRRHPDLELEDCKVCQTSNICPDCHCTCSDLVRFIRLAKEVRRHARTSKSHAALLKRMTKAVGLA